VSGRITYYGALVRIVSRGMGMDGAQVVQRVNPLTDGWIDDRSFYESSDYCYSESKAWARELAAKLWVASKRIALTTGG
jgi:hypothetical protein